MAPNVRNLFSRRKSAPLLSMEGELKSGILSKEASRSRDALAEPAAPAQRGFRNITHEVRDSRREGRRVINFDEPLFPHMRSSQASSAMTRNGADTAASSLRYSSASTEPSSFETDDRFSNRAKSGKNGVSLNSPTGSTDPRTEDGKHITFAVDSNSDNASRERGMTTSSYASTAVPPKLESFSTGDTFDDNMFAGLGEEKRKNNGGSAALQHSGVPRVPPPTFQRSDSEPPIVNRKSVSAFRMDVTKMPSPTLIGTHSQPETPLKPTILTRTSRDHLMDHTSTGPSSPESPPEVPEYLRNAVAVNSDPSQTGALESRGSEAFPAVDPSTPQRAAGRSPTLGEHNPQSPSYNPHSSPYESRPSSSDSYNTSALAFGDDKPQGNRKMTQADYERLKQREIWEEKQHIKHSARANEEIDEYYDPEEDERAAQEKEREARERRAAQLAVHRQMVKKAVGRESSEMPSSPSLGSETPTLESSLGFSLGSLKVRETTTDTHQLQYHHNMSDDDRRKSVLPPPAKSTPPLLSANRVSKLRYSDSGEDDDDVPLHLVMEAKYNKNPDNAHRLSSMGSHAAGRSSIVPSVYGGNSLGGIVNPIPPRPKSSHSTLPAFAKNLPMDPFQYGAPPLPRMSMAPGFSYQDSIGGTYKAQPSPGALGGRTLMDSIQDEEKHRKDLNRSRAKATGHHSMMPVTPGSPMSGFGTPPLTPYMAQPGMMNPFEVQMQMQMLQMQMNNLAMGGMGMGMGMGMNMNMGMPMGMGMGGMTPQQQEQMLQMQQQMNQQQMMQQMPQMPQMPQPQQQQPLNPHRASTMTSMLSPNWQIPKPMPSMDPSANRFSQMTMTNAPNFMASNYAPSLAPSERSNVGIARRYRSVTNVGDGASTVGDPVTVAPAATPNMPMPDPLADKRVSKGDKIKAYIGKRFGGTDGAAEDDYEGEDEGDDWGEMMRRRVKRAGTAAI